MKRRPTRQSIPFRNRNHTGWWIASYIELVEWSDEDQANDRLRCIAWENTILVKAKSRDVAYRKAIAKGRLGHGMKVWSSDKKHRGKWVFQGLSMLLPVYEDMEDGCEILWRDYSGKTVRTIKRMIRSKSQLEAFDDSESPK